MRLMYGSALAVAIAVLAPGSMEPRVRKQTAPSAEAESLPQAGKARPTALARSMMRSCRRTGKDTEGHDRSRRDLFDTANKASGNYTVKATFSEPKYHRT